MQEAPTSAVGELRENWRQPRQGTVLLNFSDIFVQYKKFIKAVMKTNLSLKVIKITTLTPALSTRVSNRSISCSIPSGCCSGTAPSMFPDVPVRLPAKSINCCSPLGLPVRNCCVSHSPCCTGKAFSQTVHLNPGFPLQSTAVSSYLIKKKRKYLK